MSAKVLSVRRKYSKPVHSSNTTTARLSQNPSIPTALSPPNKHHRNPSMTPTIGFSAYQVRHSAGTAADENPTGDIKSPHCVMKGTTYRKSRYLTFRLDNQRD